MSIFPRGYGPVQNQLVKAAQNLPAGATGTLFTVAGGAVLVQFLAGVVTTAIQNQACTLALGSTPTSGTAGNTAIAAATAITNKPIGTFYVPQFSSEVGGTPILANNVQVPVPAANTASAFLAYTGTITWTTSATNTGQMQWYLAYLPVDAGATVS
jgi:hypothetical protein